MKAIPPDTADVIERAYAEDLGDQGDVTSLSVIDPLQTNRADLIARERGCIAGIPVAGMCFAYIDPHVETSAFCDDGDEVDPGTVLLTVEGPTVSLLTAERVALNLLGRMSGIATLTRRYVDAVTGTKAQISDTRKTTPGLRALEKYAVAAGGGRNHRFGLYDAVLIKDNHIAAASSIAEAVTRARAAVGPDVVVQVEVDDLDQLAEVLVTEADAVLLDNMGPELLRTAVDMVDGKLLTEASGGVDLDTVGTVARSGVDVISVGALTHSARTLDVAMDVVD